MEDAEKALLDEAARKVEAATDILAQAEQAQRRAIMKVWGLRPGCIVVDRWGVRYQFVRISSIWDAGRSRPWLKARKIRKDGRPALNSKTLYDTWTVE